MLTRKEHGQDVRDMETSMHDRRAKLPTATRVKRDVNLKDKFLFERSAFYWQYCNVIDAIQWCNSGRSAAMWYEVADTAWVYY